jgi:hypothetical protein
LHYYTLRRNADLAVANGGIGNGINIRHGNGTGNFPTGTYVAAERGSPTIASADFNGDGNLDVAICNIRQRIARLKRQRRPSNAIC